MPWPVTSSVIGSGGAGRWLVSEPSGITARSAVTFRDSLMTAPHSVMQLVRKFGEQRKTCTTGPFGATHVRIEFIDPLFRALGWDVDNSQGLSLAHRDVVREDT